MAVLSDDPQKVTFMFLAPIGLDSDPSPFSPVVLIGQSSRPDLDPTIYNPLRFQPSPFQH
jgi:hypothetical protein